MYVLQVINFVNGLFYCWSIFIRVNGERLNSTTNWQTLSHEVILSTSLNTRVNFFLWCGGLGRGVWYLTPLSTMFQFNWWRKVEYPRENHRPVASHWQSLSHNIASSTPHRYWEEFKLTTLVMIGTDCISSCKSNYHMITPTTAPFLW